MSIMELGKKLSTILLIKKSLKQADGTFPIIAKRCEAKTVYTMLGRKGLEGILSSTKNAWIYIDTISIGKSTLSNLALNWEVNLQLSCRITGDKVNNFINSTNYEFTYDNKSIKYGKNKKDYASNNTDKRRS